MFKHDLPRQSNAQAAVREVLRSSGRPLRSTERAFFESRFLHDFGRVRVHSDAAAAESARTLDARAYTVGRKIVFGAGQYAPGTPAGRRLLAHELAHTRQSGNGSYTDTVEMGSASGKAESEAHRAAASVLAGACAPPSTVLCESPRIFRQPTQPTSPMPPGTARGAGFREARATAGELGMAFAGYSAEQGWAFLTGPGGSAGHRWNEPGFDGVAFRERGPFEIHILDNKSLARPGNVSSATALTRNLLSNLDDLINTASQARFNNVPRIDQVRSSLQAARAAVAGGRALPSNIRLLVTNFGGRSTGVTTRLTTQGITFRNLTGPPPPAGRAPRSLAGRPPGAAPAPSGRPSTGRQRRLTETVGVPEMRLPQAGGPSPRGQAIGAGMALAFMGANFILNWINDEIQAGRVKKALAAMEPGISRTLKEHPMLGVLLIFYYTQLEAPPESLIRPGPVFSHIEMATGRSRDEAEERWQTTPAIRAEYGRAKSIRRQQVWIPPRKPAGISALRTPFPAVAIGTFAGEAKLQDVEWGGLTGFDDEGESTLRVLKGFVPQFLILRLPSKFQWFYAGWHTSRLPVKDRPAAQGGDIPLLALDPCMPFFNVEAAFVFPADDATNALFGTAPATRDNLRHIRYVNFGKGRWVRRENIRVIRRL